MRQGSVYSLTLPPRYPRAEPTYSYSVGRFWRFRAGGSRIGFMAHSTNPTDITQIDVGIHEIYVSITTSMSYPDQLDDVSNRAYELLERVLLKAKELDIDIRRFNYSDFEDELEDLEEEAD